MAYDWEEFLVLAEKLTSGVVAGDAEHRTAISRAYYFAYHIALERAIKNGVQIKGPSRHRKCWSSYKQGTLPEAQQSKAIGIEGSRLHELRTRADYDEFKRVADAALRAIRDVKEFKKNLAALNGEYPLPGTFA